MRLQARNLAPGVEWRSDARPGVQDKECRLRVSTPVLSFPGSVRHSVCVIGGRILDMLHQVSAPSQAYQFSKLPLIIFSLPCPPVLFPHISSSFLQIAIRPSEFFLYGEFSHIRRSSLGSSWSKLRTISLCSAGERSHL
jgi:hypothetical protein